MGHLTVPPYVLFNDGTSVAFLTEVLIPISKEVQSTLESNQSFYPDAITAENLETKELIESGEINQTITVENIALTYKGYQVTKGVPFENQKQRFDNLAEDLIVITLDVNVNNNSDKNVDLLSTYANMIVNPFTTLHANYQLEYIDPNIFSIDNPIELDFYPIFSMSEKEYETYKQSPLPLKVSFSVVDNESNIIGKNQFIFDLK